ncbi:MAG: hypothetical protein HZA51_16315 [Planctomycetes bacterium]|nr:hypothetical protein [Planctomycetota bacterium]
MKRREIRLPRKLRALACREMVASLLRHGVQVIALALDDHHYHILARFPKPTDSNPWASRIPRRTDENLELALIRHYVGIAKKDSSRSLSDAGLLPQGGTWGKRCRALAVRDRTHQLNVFRYIQAHRDQGAVVWTFRDARP